MEKLFKNLRHDARMLLRNPGFTMVAALAIALGIGANTGIFSGVLWQSLPLQDPLSLAIVWEKGKIEDRNAASPANDHNQKSPNHVFGDLAGVADIMSLQLTGAGEPEELMARAVTADFFQRIGVQPILGRAFVPAADQHGNDHVVILSHRLWSRRFGGDAGIVDKNLVLNGERYQVIGILPPDFAWNNRRTDVWLPFATGPDRDYRATSGGYLTAAEPLKLGVTLRKTPTEMPVMVRVAPPKLALRYE